MAQGLKLPIIDLSSPDRTSSASLIRQACIECGFFYLVNHGVEEELLGRVFDQSSKFFSLPLEVKSKLARKQNRGYTALFAENLDPTASSKGDSKESFYIGPLEDATQDKLNQWPSEDILRSWRPTMESYYKKVLNIARSRISNFKRINRKKKIRERGADFEKGSRISNFKRINRKKKIRERGADFEKAWFVKFPKVEAFTHSERHISLRLDSPSAGKRLLSLIALALNLDEDFFEKVGGLNKHTALLRLLHYPGQLGSSDEEVLGASAHSDYGTVTLLASNGVPGLQVCREKSKQPRVWEDVLHIDGAFIVNIGDLMERWTNCLFQSTVYRVIPAGQERYSVALFLDPNEDSLVECLASCCNESLPPRFPPIRSGDYLKERFRLTSGS